MLKINSNKNIKLIGVFIMDNNVRNTPAPFEIYKHFKGNVYQILNIATHTETMETLVIYQALYGDFRIYARPLAMFLSEVDTEKYPYALEKYRFTKVTLINPQTTGTSIPMPAPESKETSPSLPAAAPSAGSYAKDSSNAFADEDSKRRAITLFMEFLDEDDFNKKRTILKSISGIATESMINNMAASLDLVVSGTSRENDIKMIDDYIRTRIHFDGARLRN